MKIEPTYFLLSVFITTLFLYFTYPSPKLIIKEPNIKERVSDTFLDDNGVCYKYYRKNIKCDNNL